MDLATAQADLAAWEAARRGLAKNASYTFSFANGTSRTVTRADLGTIDAAITQLHRQIQGLDAGARGAKEREYSTPSWT